MIYYRNQNWFISTEKVVYKRDGEVFEGDIGQEGRQWWRDFSKKWKDTEIISFDPLDNITPSVLSRLEKLNEFNISENYLEQAEEYVMSGNFPKEAGHPLVLIEREFLKVKREEQFIQQEFQDSLSKMNIYSLLEKMIKESRYGSEDEFNAKLGAFLLSGKINSEENSKLEGLLSDKLSRDNEYGVIPTGSTLLDANLQEEQITEIKEILADLTQLVLLEVE